ncbi:MAG: ATP-binding protein [Actinobacteria bacterium]|nr:ATP-binding protein [Actinomycetota bacterium]
MGRCENLTILSDPANLAKVRVAVETGGKQVGFDQKECAAMALATDEALTNVIRHAYGGVLGKEIKIVIEQLNEADDRQGLSICIRDFGKAVDPSKIKGRELSEIRPGGLGVHIMREVMDEVVFEHQPEGGTLLRMTKYHHRPRKDCSN